MLPELLVDTVVGASLHGEDEVATLGVGEGNVLSVARVSGPGEPDTQKNILLLDTRRKIY